MRYYWLLIILFHFCLIARAEETFSEYDHASIISFEEMPGSVSHDSRSILTLSGDHFKHQSRSLKWEWKSNGCYWGIKDNIGYRSRGTSASVISTFVFWVYSVKPLPDQKLRVEFLKDGNVSCFFEYGLNFSGWRGAWVAFERDMQGTPVEGMDEVRFIGSAAGSGTLFFDHIILSSLQDTRQHTADFQAPYINRNTTNHWLVLLKSRMADFDTGLKNNFTPEEVEGIFRIQSSLRDILMTGRKTKSLNELRKQVNEYKISRNSDGTIKGVPVFFERYGETYEYLGAPRYTRIYDNPMGLRRFNSTLLDLAVSYNKGSDSEKGEISQLFILMIQHMLDQGFQDGSGMGTLHHLGYSMRDFYSAAYLMEQPLKDNDLKDDVQRATEWFAGTGQIKTDTRDVEIDIDTFNTNLIGRLVSILMIDGLKERIRYLHAFTRWLNHGFEYSKGTMGSFKIDGTIFHHRHNYPAYAVGGLTGAVDAVYLLNGTAYRLSRQSHETLRKALLSMRVYCNLRTWPLSLSGRHPDGLGELNPEHFGLLAFAGTPDGKKEIDPVLAGAYLRLIKKETKRSGKLRELGFKPERSPEGNWSFNYSCLSVHRRNDWQVSAMGHSRYLWSAEIYRGENIYGRYLNHGSLQILATGRPVSNKGSGFRHEGWDWNHFPGTTAAVMPFNELKADIMNPDKFSGTEEMLLSDETFAGGITIHNRQGAFGMKLHENEKYNGSLRARKSVFFFDNRIIALGSDICSSAGEEVHTTLFQVYLKELHQSLTVNGNNNADFPMNEQFPCKQSVLSDGLNNYFFVKNNNLILSKSNQQSFDEETDNPTWSNYALAAINHGIDPGKAKYDYMILIQPDKNEIKRYLKSIPEGKVPYIVLQHDSLAHVVYDKVTGTTGYVMFEKCELSFGGPVRSVSMPCLLMTSDKDKNNLDLSACDPDLRFYEGSSDEVFDKDGKRLERSVYSMEWTNNQSKESLLEVTLDDVWEITGSETGEIKIKETGEDYTVLSISCQHGLTREVSLKRKDN